MPAWRDLAAAAPDLAATGRARLHGHTAYLATVRADGTARVHPVTPIISAERLFLFMEPDSPKGRDLARGAGYALHCGVEDNEGGAGEIWVRGYGRLCTDPALRAEAAAAASYPPRDRYVLFELSVTGAGATRYVDDMPVRQAWQAPAS